MRDVSKILSEAETVKLRALLSQTPDFPVDENFGKEYPRMLFSPQYIELYRLIKDHPDDLVKKEAKSKLNRVTVIVHNVEDEEDYITDGWKNDPNDFITMSIEDGGLGEADPRIPTGREGRRFAKINKVTREIELRDLRRRYAELTGKKLAEDVVEPEPVAAAAPVPVARPVAPSKPVAPVSADKRTRVAEAARRASAPRSSSAHA